MLHNGAWVAALLGTLLGVQDYNTVKFPGRDNSLAVKGLRLIFALVYAYIHNMYQIHTYNQICPLKLMIDHFHYTWSLKVQYIVQWHIVNLTLDLVSKVHMLILYFLQQNCKLTWFNVSLIACLPRGCRQLTSN